MLLEQKKKKLPLQRNRGAISYKYYPWLASDGSFGQSGVRSEGRRWRESPVLPHQTRASDTNIQTQRRQTWKEDKYPLVNLADWSEKFRNANIWDMVEKAKMKSFTIKYSYILYYSHILNKGRQKKYSKLQFAGSWSKNLN